MASHTSKPIRGRGTGANPPSRFERVAVVPDTDGDSEPRSRPQTVFLRDASRSAITYNTSPDIPFDASLNPYRGCEHGCSYCYARPYHEYLGWSAGLDFETRILVKEDAPELLRRELASPRWKPRVLALSGVTDPYQPVERSMRLTRRCLEVLAEHLNPVSVVTKNNLVARDADLLRQLAAHGAATVSLSLSTLDPELAGRLEPRASSPARRLAAIQTLAAAGIPTGVLVAPVIPGLTDHEIPAILRAAAAAGARHAKYLVLRLPHGVKEIFGEWLEHHAHGRKQKVLNRLRELRRGRLDDPSFGVRMTGRGALADQLAELFEVTRRSAGLEGGAPELDASAFRRPGGHQLDLFDP